MGLSEEEGLVTRFIVGLVRQWADDPRTLAGFHVQTSASHVAIPPFARAMIGDNVLWLLELEPWTIGKGVQQREGTRMAGWTLS